MIPATSCTSRLTREQLYVYPIKALRGIELQSADLGPQGIRHDRRFALFQVLENGQLEKMQLSSVPKCSLFEQKIVGDKVVVQYHDPEEATRPSDTLPQPSLEVPLHPDIAGLEKVDIDLHGSPASVYRMGRQFDSWFSTRLGFEAVLVYIGDGKRPLIGSAIRPPPVQQQQQQGWLSGITSYLTGASEAKQDPWLTFTDVAPFLVATEASLRNVSARLSDGQAVEMHKFRPNIVVEGEGEWDEDFWAELTIRGHHRLLLTGNCVRCTSLNVDYNTGQPAVGEMGTVLKKLMKDRRVDKGMKWSPVFGRYAFLANDGFELSVGDEVEVTGHMKERSVWDWPL
jgi:uncharacterized protein YcbX